MTLNDLECPIHIKVHFTGGTLDVRTLWLSDSTIRIGVARGAEGEWTGGPNPLLPLCGQLTRCFSAELLVLFPHCHLVHGCKNIELNVKLKNVKT